MRQIGVLETEIRHGPVSIAHAYRYVDHPAAPIVYLHGLGSSQEDIEPILAKPAFAKRPVLTFDYPGCGKSPYPADERLDIRDLAEITHDVITLYGLRHVLLVGHDIGAAVSMQYLQNHSENIAGLAFIEGCLTSADCNQQLEVQDMGAESFIEQGFDDMVQSLSRQESPGMVRFAATLKECNPRAYYDYASALLDNLGSDGDSLYAFGRNEKPRLFIAGDQNRAHFVHLEWLALQGVDIATIPDSNHFPMHDNPDVFYNTLDSFADQVY